MSERINDMSGTMNPNPDKTDGGNPKWPDWKGSITINGIKYWLSGWDKESQHGEFISLSFTKADDKYQGQRRPTQSRPQQQQQQQQSLPVEEQTVDSDDEVPF